MRKVHQAGVFGWIYLANLLVAFHYFTLQFVHSSFFENIIPTKTIGILFAGSSLLSLFAYVYATRILARLGTYQTTFFVAVFDFFACIGLSFLFNPILLIACFVAHTVLVGFLILCLDVFLETDSKKIRSDTGNVRGIFLTVATLASLFSPVIAGTLISTKDAYHLVYLVSGLFLVPFLAILVLKFRTFVDPVYHIFSLQGITRALHMNPNVLHIAWGQFLLRLYFSWMTIFLPIYLHTTIGFTWPEIGLVLFVMLVPYLLIEWPAGLIADNWLGEKELLILGFFITGLSTVLIALPTTPNLMLWCMILFATRTGAALVESMTETYFYKKVEGEDTDMISFFHMLRPAAYMIGPLAATAFLVFFDIRDLWIVLGAIFLTGIVHASMLEDTR